MFKPGDLVMVVKAAPCCGDVSAVGKVFIVSGLALTANACQACFNPFAAERITRFTNGKECVTSRLRLIPPLQDDITIEREIEHV